MKNISFTVITTDIKYTILENKPTKKCKGPIKTYMPFIGLNTFYLGTLEKT